MTPRQAALAASSPTLAMLLVTGVWNLWAYREPIKRWLVDWT